MYFEWNLWKILKKKSSSFVFYPSLFLQLLLWKKGSGTNNLSLFRLPNMLRRFYSLVIHHLANFDAYLKEVLELFKKITIGNLCMQATWWRHNYFEFNFVLKSYRVGQESGNCKNFKKSIFGEIKRFFIDFPGLSLVKYIKNSRHKL